MKIEQYAEDALMVYLGDKVDIEINQKLMLLKREIESWNFKGIKEIVPSYTCLTIYFNVLDTDLDAFIEKIRSVNIDDFSDSDLTYKVVEIPVTYGGTFGPDVERFKEDGITIEELIDRHAGHEYPIFMIGFMPGFPFLGGLDEKLYKARLENPRTKIPGGSVGIGGQQTGMYPFESPGGWNIIGRTPIPLYDKNRKDPILYEAGDRIVFRSVSAGEYQTIRDAYKNGVYTVKVTKRGMNDGN